MKLTRYDKWVAFKEATFDTLIASFINIPLNFVLVSIALYHEFSPIEMTLFFTAVFSIVAIWRKTMVRLHFQKRHNKTL